MNTSKEKWDACDALNIPDVIRWKEPLWAEPNRPRGKPDKIGEQMITARLIDVGEPLELQVIQVERLSLLSGVTDAPAKIKKDDIIRRKISSINKGECQKRVQE